MSGGYTKFKVDGKTITQLQSDLGSLISEFHSASDSSGTIADAVGYDDLADKLRDFASKWKDKRKDMVTAIENLKKIVDAIVEGTDKLDGDLKKALENTKEATGTGKATGKEGGKGE